MCVCVCAAARVEQSTPTTTFSFRWVIIFSFCNSLGFCLVLLREANLSQTSAPPLTIVLFLSIPPFNMIDDLPLSFNTQNIGKSLMIRFGNYVSPSRNLLFLVKGFVVKFGNCAFLQENPLSSMPCACTTLLFIYTYIKLHHLSHYLHC